jgi:predicted NBD/HSP70 family sugar kinase
MIENEKRIITLLARRGPLSKKSLSRMGRMGWATVVKIVNRLGEAGILARAGTAPKTGGLGKNAYVFDLSPRLPLALGIDIEYSYTHLVLANLKNEILSQHSIKTPRKPDMKQLEDFIVHTASAFMRSSVQQSDYVHGIGIGLPLWLATERQVPFFEMKSRLSRKLHMEVRVENNVRAYTMYKKWAGKAFHLKDFILITIRGGVGTGIFLDGSLLRGAQGLAGELGHLTLEGDGRECRCGKKGCLETLVNQYVLYQSYVEKVLGEAVRAEEDFTEQRISQGLVDLFARAKQSEPVAVQVVREAALYLAEGIAILIKILNIPDIILAAHFGAYGDVLLPYIEEELNDRILPQTQYRLSYYPLENMGFTLGAALLILRDYYSDFAGDEIHNVPASV